MLFGVATLFLVIRSVANAKFHDSDKNESTDYGGKYKEDLAIIKNETSCRFREAINWSSGGVKKVTLRCGSKTALINYLKNVSTSQNEKLNERSFESLELICSNKKANVINPDAERDLRSLASSPIRRKLLSLAIHNCDTDALNVLSLFANIMLLNMSQNYFSEIQWQNFVKMEIQVLDLRNNFLDCSQCANKWIHVFSKPTTRNRFLNNFGAHNGHFWDVGFVFPFIPQKLLVDESSFHSKNSARTNCFFSHCDDETVELKPSVFNTTVGAPLRLECRFRSGQSKAASNLLLSSSPFYWLFRDSQAISQSFMSGLSIASFANVGQANLNAKNLGKVDDDSLKTTVEWLNSSFVVLNKQFITSNDLGFVACKCFICDVPIFNVSQIYFNVNMTAVIKDNLDSSGDSQLIVHGCPIDQIILKITRLSDQVSEQQLLSQHKPNSFFNDSFLVKYQDEHSHFFLKYYSLYIHHCTDCSHTIIEGDYLLELCQNSNGCAKVLHRFAFRTSNTMYVYTTFVPTVIGRQVNTFTYIVLFAIVLSLSASFIWLASKGSWKIRRKIPLLQVNGWEFKRRRISRNTNRTEETSIPLEDTLSNTGFSTSYSFVAQHVPMIDAKELSIKYKIGRGAFGEVFTADWESKNEKVAIKTLHVHMDAEMDKEAAMLAKLDHLNVLRLYGVSNINGKIALVMEMMNQGDLKSYLRNREPRCDNYSQFPPGLLQTELINISVQVCTGLSYLASQQIVHRDLAARNCLASGESDMKICSPAFRPPITIKISDFGMSRRLYSDAEYYRMHDSKTALPVRWLPPECLSFGKFTHQADMWSFGMTLFEIFTYGGMPFGNLSNEEVLTAVVSGIRPGLPPKCPATIEKIIKSCWLDEPSARITADDALIQLRSFH